MAACGSTTDWKTPRLRRRLVRVAKKPSTALSQEAEVGVKWNIQRGWRQPFSDLGVLVGGVVVEDRMDGLAGGALALDGVEETDELLMPMALHVAVDHGSVEHVHRRKQRRRAIALVIMSHRSRPALLHRQAGLGSVERLDLALLVDGKDNSVRRRIDLEPDRVAQFVDERRVIGELELPDAVWLKSVGAPDALHGRDADAGCLRHRCAGPMRGFGPRRLHRQRHDAFGDSGIKLRDARRPRLVAQQPFKALVGKAFLPAPDAGLRLARLAHDRARVDPSAVSKTIRARQTCFCGAFRSLTSARSRSRSAEETERVTPARIPQTRTPQVQSESLIGFKCQI
jgi:hypothetical protein